MDSLAKQGVGKDEPFGTVFNVIDGFVSLGSSGKSLIPSCSTSLFY